MDSSLFWGRAERIRKDRGLSWQDVAEAAKLSAQCMASARYLRSEVRLGTAIRLAEALNCSAADLCCNADEMTFADVDPIELTPDDIEIFAGLRPDKALPLLWVALDGAGKKKVLEAVGL